MVVYAVPYPGSFFHKLRLRDLGIEINIKKDRKYKGYNSNNKSERTEEIFLIPVDEYEKYSSSQREKGYYA